MEPLILEPLILLSGRRAGKMRLRHSASGINGSTCGVKLENLMGGDLSRAFATGATERKGERRRQAHTRSSLQSKHPAHASSVGEGERESGQGSKHSSKLSCVVCRFNFTNFTHPLRPT